MADFDGLWMGFVTMVGCCLLGLLLSMFGGLILDSMWKQMDIAGAFDVSPAWQSVGTQYASLNLWYFFCALIPVLGIFNFVYSLIKKKDKPARMYNF
jgi:hypothetical protein